MNNIDILEELKPEKMDLIQLIRTRDLLSENWDLIFNDNEDEDIDI